MPDYAVFAANRRVFHWRSLRECPQGIGIIWLGGIRHACSILFDAFGEQSNGICVPFQSIFASDGDRQPRIHFAAWKRVKASDGR